MGKFKQIKSHDEIEDDPDGVTFGIEYNKDMTEIYLSMKANKPVTPEEYFNTVAEFLNTVSENPESLFVEDPNEDSPELH